MTTTTQLRRSLTSHLGDTPEAVVLGFLGDQVDSFDVPGLTDAYRAAIAENLASRGIDLAGDTLYATYPVPDRIDDIIETAIEYVDLGEIAPRFDRDL